jgi:hypothetical protein
VIREGAKSERAEAKRGKTKTERKEYSSGGDRKPKEETRSDNNRATKKTREEAQRSARECHAVTAST